MAADHTSLYTLTSFDSGRSLKMPSIRVAVTLADKRVVTAPLDLRPLTIGTSADCELIIPDPRVSRRHCELRLTERGVMLRDLGSKNGTLLGNVPIIEIFLPLSVPVAIGNSELVIQTSGSSSVIPLASSIHFGEALGQSFPMRAVFGKLERAAPTDETILLLGESGTGKEVLAKAIHQNSRRHNGPFVVVDCGAIAPNLAEGELFGHIRGAFTGAQATQPGLLEMANGGTLFIDEIGELPMDLQPKLLRALESRQIRRLGASDYRPFDARIVAATHRNLKTRVAEGAFREDLYYRLAVVTVHVPALRERKDDIPLLVERFLTQRDPPRTLSDLPLNTLSLLKAHEWPGNVRELRNTVARLLLFPELIEELIDKGRPETPPPSQPPRPSAPPAPPKEAEKKDGASVGKLLDLKLPEAREVVLEEFEREYVAMKLKQYDGNVSKAAEAMGVSRQLVHRLIERYGLRGKGRVGEE